KDIASATPWWAAERRSVGKTARYLGKLRVLKNVLEPAEQKCRRMAERFSTIRVASGCRIGFAAWRNFRGVKSDTHCPGFPNSQTVARYGLFVFPSDSGCTGRQTFSRAGY